MVGIKEKLDVIKRPIMWNQVTKMSFTMCLTNITEYQGKIFKY